MEACSQCQVLQFGSWQLRLPWLHATLQSEAVSAVQTELSEVYLYRQSIVDLWIPKNKLSI